MVKSTGFDFYLPKQAISTPKSSKIHAQNTVFCARIGSELREGIPMAPVRQQSPDAHLCDGEIFMGKC